MDVIKVQSETSLIKANIPNIISKDFYDNHKVILRTTEAQQELSSAYSEIVTVQYDISLIATIIENSDI